MLRWAAICLFLAILAGVLGFGSLDGVPADVARFLFFFFAALVVVLVALAVYVGRKVF